METFGAARSNPLHVQAISWVAFGAILISGNAWAVDDDDVQTAERWDHRGAVGLLVGAAADARALVDRGAGVPSEYLLVIPVELGVSLGLTDNGSDFFLMGRAAPWAKDFRAGLLLSYRGYFGQEQWKTFFDAGLSADLPPTFTIGPRLGFGVQYELSPVAGVYVGAAAHVGAGGSGIRFGVEVMSGIQLRTYLLE